MSSIDLATVEKVANLAQLSLSQEELVYYQDQLQKILGYMDILQSLDDSLNPDWRPDLELTPTPEREDEAYTSRVIDKVLASAPKVVGTAFQVPRILE